MSREPDHTPDPTSAAAPRGEFAAAASVLPPAVLSVSALVGKARTLVERDIGLVWVAGEISNFTRAASGHCYFNLKDEQAQVRCVYFRQKAQFASFPLANGIAIEARATASVYEARGEFQLNVETVRRAGQGALYEKFARLKARLEAAGWFEPTRKRALPAWPRAVGIVTSTRAAALADLVTTLARRWPALRVVVYPTAVQGEGAAASVAQAIRTANERAEVEVLIVARGGGSIEDLWAFNEEAVAQAVFESALPIVSGVGHETDFTICDFVADVRAPTPTGAAALVAPDRAAVARDVAATAHRLERALERSLEARMQRLDLAGRRLVHPASRLAQQARDAKALAERLARALQHRHDTASVALGHWARRLAWRLAQPLPQAARLAPAALGLQRVARVRLDRVEAHLSALAQSVAHLNPQGVLERGYAIVSARDGSIVSDSSAVCVGDEIEIAFAQGNAGATVTRV
jgi:exodeoxyribonuclease VII large subunit